MTYAPIDPVNGYQRNDVVSFPVPAPAPAPAPAFNPNSSPSHNPLWIQARQLLETTECWLSTMVCRVGGKVHGIDKSDCMDVQFPDYLTAISMGRDSGLLPYMSLTFPEFNRNLSERVTITFDLPAIAAASVKGDQS